MDFPTPELPVKAETFPGQQLAHLVHALAGDRGNFQAGHPGQIVHLFKGRGALQIGFGQHQNGLDVLQLRHGNGLVHNQGFGVGVPQRGDDEQLVDVGDGRPHQEVAPGQDLLQGAGAVLLGQDAHPIPA